MARGSCRRLQDLGVKKTVSSTSRFEEFVLRNGDRAWGFGTRLHRRYCAEPRGCLGLPGGERVLLGVLGSLLRREALRLC